jgi:hypothetical protein
MGLPACRNRCMAVGPLCQRASQVSTSLKMQPQVLCCVLLHTPLAYTIRLTTRLPLPITPYALAMHAPDDDSSCTACKLQKPGCPAQCSKL